MVQKLLARKDDSARLVERIRALDTAAGLCEGRVDDRAVAEARRLIEQADRRLAISGDATVVALAGATGSGKSSTFNALSGTDMAVVGVRRPTTSQALAASWGDKSAEELLDWLKIPRRHAVEDDPAEAAALDGLVLLDLPDHDSTELSHRMEVDRLVQLVDLLVWVVDPQKYADAALHDRYLKPLARHADVMMVVLNQADTLTPDERDQCLRDLERLLAAEGLGRVEVLAVSAVTGEGIAELRRLLARQVAEKKAAARRLAADVTQAAELLAGAQGGARAKGLPPQAIDRLNRTLARAAGVPIVTDAVRNAWRLRGGLATGWPVLAWVAKFKPDPLRRLHLDRLGAGGRRKELDPARISRTSLPAAGGVHDARVESALRDLADEVSAGLSRGWVDAVKAAARSQHALLPDSLDRAMATTDLDLDRHRRWWTLVRILQWLLVVVVLAGLGWLGSAFVFLYLQLPPLPRVAWWGLPAPTVLVVGGVIAGLLLAGLSRIGVEVGARRRAARAGRALRAAIGSVSKTRVLDPVTAELERYEQARLALEQARS
ncbi:50S ribosome-binding GTPase [Microlunatus panaciterrae]|uniref:GTP-binding protein EngB required for normal cell division n=1 Tax=Microlunatus panaciterrae TaxID=400768 RepID=A0ABS2RMQ9_9ACTN|nr:YfjP family GTPase [Microlunatus panaciterrae]MBM7799872.1 GTP-binding protein EngB required for normal cell division [Microlunatus panaciterrae]